MNFAAYNQALTSLSHIEDLNALQLYEGDYLKGKHILPHSTDCAALYHFSDLSAQLELVCAWIDKYYPEARLTLLDGSGKALATLDFTGKACRENLVGKTACFLYFPPIAENTSLQAFRELVAHLRAPEGCPWDREQTHQSLKSNLLEETYEVLDAIEGGAPADLQEELGDLLLQIILHAQISSEADEFSIDDVIQGIHKKITFRHPHVFKELEVKGIKDVFHNWEVLKSQERENNPEKKDSILDSIPRALPSLLLAQNYQERAARVGFDWPDVEPVLDKVIEEVGELRAAQTKAQQEAELGDLFFALVNVSRWYGFNAEDALRKMTVRFFKRFRRIEEEALRAGRKVTDLSPEEMDTFWELAKQDESTDDPGKA
jgi:tetrapyrrole methylase family protein/MazG family protein